MGKSQEIVYIRLAASPLQVSSRLKNTLSCLESIPEICVPTLATAPGKAEPLTAARAFRATAIQVALKNRRYRS